VLRSARTSCGFDSPSNHPGHASVWPDRDRDDRPGDDPSPAAVAAGSDQIDDQRLVERGTWPAFKTFTH